MSFTVTPLLTTYDDAESTTPWNDGALDPDFFVQGSNSIGWYGSKNGRASVTVDVATDPSWSAGDHLYFWTASSVAAKMEDKTTGTTTASGVTARVTLVGGAYREWHVAGADVWAGEWKCFVVDMGHTGTELYASSGTFSDATAIESITFYYDLSNSGNIRNVPANIWNDVVRFGTGLSAYNTSAADPSFDITDIATNDELTANRYGILELKDGVVFAQGEIQVGDTGTNHLDFDSQDEVLVFSERDGSGSGIVDDNLYEFSVVANATGTDQDFNMGVKVGTGDTASGRNGTQIRSGGSAVEWYFNADDADLHSVTLYGSTILGAFRTGATYGVTFTGPTTTGEFIGNTVDSSGQVNSDDLVVRNVNFLNTKAATTSGALRWTNGTTDARNCLFVNNVVAVEVPSLTADVTFIGMEFQSNTNDVRYEGTTDWDLNWSDAPSAPSILNASTGTLTAVNTVNTTIVDVPTGAEWRLYEADPTQGIIGSTELDGEESHTGGNIIYSDNYTADTNGALQVLADGYVEYLRYFVLGSSPQTLTVVLTPETNT